MEFRCFIVLLAMWLNSSCSFSIIFSFFCYWIFSIIMVYFSFSGSFYWVIYWSLLCYSLICSLNCSFIYTFFCSFNCSFICLCCCSWVGKCSFLSMISRDFLRKGGSLFSIKSSLRLISSSSIYEMYCCTNSFLFCLDYFWAMYSLTLLLDHKFLIVLLYSSYKGNALLMFCLSLVLGFFNNRIIVLWIVSKDLSRLALLIFGIR